MFSSLRAPYVRRYEFKPHVYNFRVSKLKSRWNLISLQSTEEAKKSDLAQALKDVRANWEVDGGHAGA